MKGDFSRNTFDPDHPYHSVRMQQGRILLDADWNEQVDILNLRQARALRHLIGDHGGIASSFRIALAESSANGGAGEEGERPWPSLLVHPGQYYVAGNLCELGASHPLPLAELPTPFDWQAHLQRELSNRGAAIVYLKVWEQHVTALDDPQLLEPALAGQDTTTRTRLVWQIRLLPLTECPPDDTSPADWPIWQEHVRVAHPALEMKRGYVTVNSLYRIEIHDVREGVVTWKWSRANAAMAYRLTGVQRLEEDADDELPLERLRVTVERALGDTAGLAARPALELTCETWRANDRPGLPVTLLSDPDSGPQPTLDLRLASAITAADLQALQRDATLRQWDHDPSVAGGMLPLKPGVMVPLEQGIEVTFPETDRYRPGDTWQIPMRTSDAVGERIEVSWRGPRHVYAPLALLHLDNDDGWQLRDLRRSYVSLVDVFAQLFRLREELNVTRQALASLHAETDWEDEEQEDEISALQQEVKVLHTTLDQLAGRQNGRHVRTYRSEQELDVGEVVARSRERDDYIVRASRDTPPIGVIAPRPEDHKRDEYVVVLFGRALCRVYGPVQPGDLLEVGKEPGHLAPVSLWTRWFQSQRIFARAMDIATTAEYHLIEVFVLPWQD